MEMTIREMLGQKLIFGFHGTQFSEEFIDLVKTYKIGNVILFLRNVESEGQLRRLCGEIQTLIRQETGYPAFIVIDQEGGMVSRLPPEGVNVPGAMALGATGDPENAREASEITIRQLRGLGPNFNMAPVLDVNNNPKNPVIGVRSFGDDPYRVAQFGAASAKPYAGSGVLCCGKHFPGHGDTAVDSHLGLPTVEKTEEELEALELIPFRHCIREGIPAMMISHVMFPHIEPEQVPCTMSRRIITGLLKEKLGFQGLILTDCMEMLAIQDHYGTPEGTVAAIKAGVDLAEISSTLALERAAAQALNEAAERGELDLEEIRSSVAKILEYKKQIDWEPEQNFSGREEDRARSRALAAKAITCCEGTPFSVDGNTIFCGCADYRVSGVGNESGGAVAFPDFMAAAFGGTALVTAKDPDEEDIARAVAQAKNAEKIVLTTCNAHLFRGQLALARALAETGKPMMIVALRNPYDIPLLPDCACKIATYDYSLDAFRGLEAVFGGSAMEGVCPVKL